MSLMVTTASPSTLTGIDITSSTDSKTPGTLIENRPFPVSMAPAAISWLKRETTVATCSGSSW